MALQVLYQLEQNSGVVNPEVRRFIERRVLGERELVLLTLSLVEGVRVHQEKIDEAIKQVAENWRLDRMAAIDRNILRLGAFEILHRDDIPAKIAINEAIELAKRYSTAQSSRFVNGILDKLLQSTKPARANAGAVAEDAAEAEPTSDPDSGDAEPTPEPAQVAEEGPAA